MAKEKKNKVGRLKRASTSTRHVCGVIRREEKVAEKIVGEDAERGPGLHNELTRASTWNLLLISHPSYSHKGRRTRECNCCHILASLLDYL